MFYCFYLPKKILMKNKKAFERLFKRSNARGCFLNEWVTDFQSPIILSEYKVSQIAEFSVKIRYFFFVNILIPTSVPTIRTTPMGREMYHWGTKPAMIYVTNETPATVRA